MSYIVLGKDKDNKIILLKDLYLYSLNSRNKVCFIDEVSQDLLDSIVTSPEQPFSVNVEELKEYDFFTEEKLDKWISCQWTLKEVNVSKFFFTNDTDLGLDKCLGLYFQSDSGSLVARRFEENVGPVVFYEAHITKGELEELDKPEGPSLKTSIIVDEHLRNLYGKGFRLNYSEFVHPLSLDKVNRLLSQDALVSNKAIASYG